MGLLVFMIYSVVCYFGWVLKNVKNKIICMWVFIGLGLVVVLFLLMMFDEFVENVVEWIFYKGFVVIGGDKVVGDVLIVGREKVFS